MKLIREKVGDHAITKMGNRISLSRNGLVQCSTDIKSPYQFENAVKRLQDWYFEQDGKDFIADVRFVSHIIYGSE